MQILREFRGHRVTPQVDSAAALQTSHYVSVIRQVKRFLVVIWRSFLQDKELFTAFGSINHIEFASGG